MISSTSIHDVSGVTITSRVLAEENKVLKLLVHTHSGEVVEITLFGNATMPAVTFGGEE